MQRATRGPLVPAVRIWLLIADGEPVLAGPALRVACKRDRAPNAKTLVDAAFNCITFLFASKRDRAPNHARPPPPRERNQFLFASKRDRAPNRYVRSRTRQDVVSIRFLARPCVERHPHPNREATMRFLFVSKRDRAPNGSASRSWGAKRFYSLLSETVRRTDRSGGAVRGRDSGFYSLLSETVRRTEPRVRNGASRRSFYSLLSETVRRTRQAIPGSGRTYRGRFYSLLSETVRRTLLG